MEFRREKSEDKNMDRERERERERERTWLVCYIASALRVANDTGNYNKTRAE
jgi:hypothetical protein